jgi:hypothetical protein
VEKLSLQTSLEAKNMESLKAVSSDKSDVSKILPMNGYWPGTVALDIIFLKYS